MLADDVLGFVSDVREPSTLDDAVNGIIEAWGQLDVLIANAGVGNFGSITDLSHEKWNETIDINLTGVFNSVKSTVSELTKSKGYIITIASLGRY